MSDGFLRAARDDLATHLDAELDDDVIVVSGSPEKMQNSDKYVLVHTDACETDAYRHRVTIVVSCHVRVSDHSQENTDDNSSKLTADVVEAFTDFASAGPPKTYWPGWGASLTADSMPNVENIDGTEWAITTVTTEVAVDRTHTRTRGPLETQVAKVLTDAGLTVYHSCDTPPGVVLRPAGSAPDDPWSDTVMVWVVAGLEDGTLEAETTKVWNALWNADGITVLTDIGVDLGGQPPGSLWPHAVAEMTVRGDKRA